MTTSCAVKSTPESSLAVPDDLAPVSEQVDVLHGVSVADPYRIMETPDLPEVQAWDKARNDAFYAYTADLAQRPYIYERLQGLWRYDDESTPRPCLLSEREMYWTKKADQDKWVVHMREAPGAEGRVLIDPNTWEATETLASFTASPDCTYAVFGKAKAGNEDPVLQVMRLDTLEVLADTMSGWKQGGVSWLHDNSGFYFSGKPNEGEVADGMHYYYHRTWFHTVGTQADKDRLEVFDDDSKETWNGVQVTEDGKWLIRYRSLFNKNELWLRSLTDANAGELPVTANMDNESWATVVDDRVYIWTDWQAPNRQMMVADVKAPHQENWKPWLAETKDPLSSVEFVGGQRFAVYQHNASTRIIALSPEAAVLNELKLPTVGSASVSGYWSKPEVRVSFSSFTYPSASFTYSAADNALTLLKASPKDVDTSNMEVEQVWYPSKDGVEVSMFVIRRKDAPKDGTVPTLLYGYGGFNISLLPGYRDSYVVWLESGGQVAIPNLRGGGEYGVAWHEAGMREKKQNVFDDLIAAAEYLIGEKYTSSDLIAIKGGSNGGLLVSAAVTQRPELFQAVLCMVPLTDMIRFHQFGLANIWTEEYGSADDPEMFPYIHAYSPYHRVKAGTDYPAILVTGSINDARTDPVHARKFAAAVRAADVDHGMKQPILLHLQADSGHGGAVTLDQRADQASRHDAFMMHQLGMKTPSESSAPEPEVSPEK